MTKCCEACHTVNRDRAQYCRGCARRFREPGSPPLRSGVSVPGTAAFGAAGLAGVATLPRPAPALARDTAFSYPTGRDLLGLLFPAAAAMLASLVVWQQWSEAAELRAQPGRAAAQVRAQPAAAAPVAATASAGASAAVAAPEPVPQESLLALAMEHSARDQLASQEAVPAASARILEPEGSGTPAGAPGPAVFATQSDMGLPPDATVASATTSRPAASRHVAASARPSRRTEAARPFYGPTPVALQAQGITGPCNRYNPFGEVTCANVSQPRARGQVHASAR